MKYTLSKTILIGMAFSYSTLTHAVPLTYSNDADFFSSISGYSTSTLNFDSQTPGTEISNGETVGGITFGYSFGGTQMMVSNAYDTTSSDNFLGTNDIGDMFLDGDDFTLEFSASNAFGLYFLSGDLLFNDDIWLTVGSSVSSLVSSDLISTLSDGSNVYFLGISDSEASFTSVSINTIGGGYFSYNVDDITTASISTVPVPSTLFLFTFAIPALRLLNPKKSSTSVNTAV